jgi:hypothetical protein
MRIDPGFTGIYKDDIPSTAVGGPYASIRGTGGMPGVIFSGPGSPSPSFGLGQASQNPFKWQVVGDLFTATHSLVPTSYTFLLEIAKKAGITPNALNSLSELHAAVAHGVYQTTGDLTVNAAVTLGSPGSPKNFIILVNGTLYLNQYANITVAAGSTAIFSAKKDLVVAEGLGELAASTICNIVTHAGCTIEGFYSADHDFIAEGNNDCASGPDKRLNVAGSVVANAGRSGGQFKNNRTLCQGNALYPSVSFTERPDFLINYPAMLKSTTKIWQEIAP